RKLTAIQSTQSQSVIEGCAMLVGLSFGLERCAYDLLEQRHRQKRPALGQSPVGDAFSSQCFHVLGQCAGLRYRMKDQAVDQFLGTDDRRTTPTQTGRTY